jgi:hypothetical protein
MIGALELLSADDPEVERKLTMGTSILQREERTGFATRQYNRVAGERDSQHTPWFKAAGTRDRIPEIRVNTDPPKIGDAWMSAGGLHADLSACAQS